MMMKSFKSVLLKCALPSWYEDFKNLTIESYIIQIPEDVFNYFKDDVFVLPKECNAHESLDIEYGDPGEDMIEVRKDQIYNLMFVNHSCSVFCRSPLF